MPALNQEQTQTAAPQQASAATQQSAEARPADRSTPTPDKDGYYRLGHTTLRFLLLKYGFPAIILGIVELILLGAAAGGNNLPPFSQMVSADRTFAALVHAAAGIVPILIIFAVLFALAMAYSYYLSFRYKIEENDLSFERGIVGIQEISIPFRQIQNVDIEASALYRLFSLADLVILTAGHEDPMHARKDETEIVMPALNVREAPRLQQFLLDRSNVQRTVVISASTEPAQPAPLA